ncbi:MAG: SusC/RagA family TonB-linked outer membrane protein [Candidatus Bipolaricaulia bacterium]
MHSPRLWSFLAATLVLVTGLSVLVHPAIAQDQHSVQGTVTDAADDSPLPGVNVVVKGTTVGTTTDSRGMYQLRAPSPQDTLVFSFVGFQRRQIPLQGRSTIDVKMRPEVLKGQEVVVTGYQTQEKANITGAVSSVEPAEIQATPQNNPIKSLQGRVPGLTINTDGSPSGDAQVLIRGTNTLNDNSPLYVIDGVPTKSGIPQSINPNDIKSIQVLKDAASASIYGARASNGVIVIETKEGGDDGLSINYSTDISTSQYVSKIDMLNTKERGRVIWEATINDGNPISRIPLYDYEWEGTTGNLADATLKEVKVAEFVDNERENPIIPAQVPGTNWYDKISRQGLIQNHNLSASYGTDRGSARLSLRYHDDQGIIKERNFREYTARINSSFELFDGRLTVGENLTIAHGRGTTRPRSIGGTPLNLALLSQPILPVKTTEGNYAGPFGAGFDDRSNPVRVIKHNRWDIRSNVHTFGNVYAEGQILENLTGDVRFGVDYNTTDVRDIQRTYQSGFLSRNVNSLQNQNMDDTEWTFSSTLEYDPVWGTHDATFLVGTEAVKSNFVHRTTYREEFAIETLDYFVENAGQGSQSVSGRKTGASLLSYFGKVDYNYDSRYLLSATFRLDGSSKFGSNRRFGTFPSVSVGWRFANESFVKNNLDFLSGGKIRVGLGITGNDQIANNARFALFEARYGDPNICCFWRDSWDGIKGTAYDLKGSDSGSLPSGFRQAQAGNPDLQWEETTEYNVGLELGFFDQALTASADYFQRKTTDILIQPPAIAACGEGCTQFANGATVETWGFEGKVGYSGNLKNVSYNVSGNVGFFRDEVTELPADVIDAYPGNSEKTILGHSPNANFGYVADGIFQNQQEVQDHADQPGKGVGRLRFKDLNGDGAITSLDQKYLGDPQPDFSYGLNTQISWKNLTLSGFLQGVYGPEVYNPRKVYTDFTSIWGGANYGERTLNAWTPNNRNTSIPALTRSDNNNEQRFSTYFIEDGSYLKLREVQLGYKFPQSLIQVVRAKRARVYVRAENFLLFKDDSGDDAYTSPDPENPNQAFPRPRIYTFGVDLTF